MTDKQGLVVSRSMLRLPIALVVAGAVALVAGLIVSPAHT